MAQANWRPAGDVGSHDQDRPGTLLRTVSLRLGTMQKELGEHFDCGRSNMECLYPRRGQLNCGDCCHKSKLVCYALSVVKIIKVKLSNEIGLNDVNRKALPRQIFNA